MNKLSTFQQRTITGTIFVIVMLSAMFYSKLSFQILFGLVAVGSLYEFFRVMLESDGTLLGWVRWLLAICFGWIPYLMTLLQTNEFMDYQIVLWSALCLSVPAVFAFLILELFLKSEKPFQNISVILFSAFYIGMPFSVLNYLIVANTPFQNFHYHPSIALGLILLTWTNDTFAYLVGSRIGKTPLFPRHSPKKTWEGTIGGIIFCMLTALIFPWIDGFNFFEKRSLVLHSIDWMILGAIVSTFGTLGDLVESMLKRSVGVKDSGSLMPGHGGLLDRFDAYIFVIPFAFLYLMFR
jgi:phosphatidate cytidylyltransferase